MCLIDRDLRLERVGYVGRNGYDPIRVHVSMSSSVGNVRMSQATWQAVIVFPA